MFSFEQKTSYKDRYEMHGNYAYHTGFLKSNDKNISEMLYKVRKISIQMQGLVYRSVIAYHVCV